VDAASRDAALQFVAEQRALGGTNISDALATALAVKKDPTRPFLVIFLTDGMPTVGVTDVEAILKETGSKKEATTRLFVFGIGHDVNTTLLDRLADENRGARDYVGEREDLELKVSSFFAKVSSPVLANVKLAVEGISTGDLHPKTLPDLFRGSQMLVTGRYKGAGEAKVKVTGDVNGKPVAYDYALTFGAGGKDPSIARLWAVRKVGYLIDQIRLNGESKELKDEVVRLGVKYGIVTPYTSYLVVEDTPAPVGGPRRTLGAAGAPGGRVPGGGVAKDERGRGDVPGAPAPAEDTASNAERALDDADESESKKFARVERAKTVEELRRGWHADPVALSKEVLKLRESQSAGGRAADALVRRVGDRTFYARGGLFVDSAALALDEETLKAKVVKVSAFSDAYFDLVSKKPALAAVLALGDVLFVDGGTVYLVTAPESRPL
jgi:Ca-activated chloride channel homolog